MPERLSSCGHCVWPDVTQCGLSQELHLKYQFYFRAAISRLCTLDSRQFPKELQVIKVLHTSPTKPYQGGSVLAFSYWKSPFPLSQGSISRTFNTQFFSIINVYQDVDILKVLWSESYLVIFILAWMTYEKVCSQLIYNPQHIGSELTSLLDDPMCKSQDPGCESLCLPPLCPSPTSV